MSEIEFKPGDKVRFRVDVPESERTFIGFEGGVRIIPAGEALEVVALPGTGLPVSPPQDFLLVAWSGFRVAVRRACLEPCEDRPKCTCDIGILIAAGCRCGGA